ncbi:hypothetical protein KHA80_21635 [Anaerobacillus sp. HL2]|nr:hypothetical protein KHA80_21635 [Anaerobacillus sp. HL2]
MLPIVALTLEETMAIKDVVNSNDWIAPLHWQQNLDQQSFEKWQKEIERKRTANKKRSGRNRIRNRAMANCFKRFQSISSNTSL